MTTSVVRKIVVSYSPSLKRWIMIIHYSDNTQNAWTLDYDPDDEELKNLYGDQIVIVRQR